MAGSRRHNGQFEPVNNGRARAAKRTASVITVITLCAVEITTLGTSFVA